MTKEDKRAYERAWCKKNRAKKQASNDKWRDKQIEWFREYKTTLKCSRCPESDSCCLDFHHKNPKIKDGPVSVLASRWSTKRLLTEIKKCIVLCANCHRKLHDKD
jgi:hypothetical protein